MSGHEPSVTQQAKLDAICLEFEQAWREGERPRIESYLGDLNDAERAQLLPELLLLELEHLQRSQTAPEVDDYLARFPHDHTLVRLVLRAFEGGPEATVDHAPIAEHVGSTIGRYKLLEQIGEGGMGVVYMAEQQRPVRRKVALKIIKPGMDSKQVVARFEVERQALAMMDHPNIARVFDAGTTDSGLPYFVMELVRGVPITQFCDENKLATSERLKLFALVCQAVQHAHTKGIIHRDMKPTNVLVTLHDGVPVPKIIDFGVAKATGQQLTERTLFTAFAQMVGTPLYMSPEQAELSGLDIDTRSDIYSLGVLLYELLIGTTPFDRKRMQSAAYDEVRRIIREEEPEKPSTRVSTMGEASTSASQLRSTDPARLKQTLRGELDWIVMKALEKDRNRRYETASALATEITRYLSGEPVAAGPPSTTYRLRKFAGRYRKQVTVAGGFLALVLISSILSWFLYVDARRARDDALAAGAELTIERDRAKREQDRAESAESSARLHADELKQRLYDYNMIQAQAAYERDDATQTLTLLEDCLTPQRRWEWHRLNQLVRHDIAREYALPNKPVGIAISPAGSLMAIGDREGVLHILDTRSGDTLWTESGTHEVLGDAKFSMDGKLISVVRRNKNLLLFKDIDGTLQTELYVCDAMTGNRVWHAEGNNDQFLWVGFSPDSRRLAVSLGKNDARYCIQLRNVDDGALIWSANTDNPTSGAIEFSPDGHRLFMSLRSGDYLARPSRLVCWNADNHEEIWGVDREVTSRIALSPDGAWLATGGENHSVQIWDAATGKEVAELQGEFAVPPRLDVGEHTFVAEVIFSHDGSTLGARGGQGITFWDWPSKQQRRSIYHPRVSGDGGRIHISANDKHFVLRDQRLKGNVVFRDIDPPRTEIPLVGHESPVRGVDFSKDGGQLASIGLDGTLRYWNASTGQEVRTTIVTPTDGYAVAHSPAGDYVATAGDDRVKLWETRSGVLKHHWPEIGKPFHVTFSDDGQRLAAGGDVLRVWNVADGRQLWADETPQDVYGVAFCRDNLRLVTVDRLASIQLVDLAIPRPTVIKPEEQYDADEDVRCLVRDPTSDIIAVGIKNRIELWDPEDDILKTLANDDAVRCLVFNHDGTRLFSGDSSGMVRVWNVETGAQLLGWSSEQGIVYSLALSPDGKTLATAGENGTIKLWETARPADETIARRQIVAEATRIVNERYSQSTSQRDVLESLTSDASIDDQVLPAALEIANARGNRPVQPWDSTPDPDRRDVGANVRKNLDEAQRGLIDLIEDAAGFELKDAANNWRQSQSPSQWHGAAIRLTAPDTAPLPPAAVNGLLSMLIDAHPRVHQFVYMRGLLHARYGRWAEADADFSSALRVVPENTLLWHEYAYRLAFLLAYTEQTDRYRQLCETTLKNFGDTQDIQLAERTAKMCLFLPADSEILEQATALADLARAATDGSPDWLRPYLALCHGIAGYRRGDFSGAVESLETVTTAFGAESSYFAATHLFMAMAYQQLGRHEVAEKMLQELQSLLDQIDRQLQQRTGDEPGNWNDAMIVHLVRPEAEALIFEE